MTTKNCKRAMHAHSRMAKQKKTPGFDPNSDTVADEIAKFLSGGGKISRPEPRPADETIGRYQSNPAKIGG